jgi:hypothetical protein
MKRIAILFGLLLAIGTMVINAAPNTQEEFAQPGDLITTEDIDIISVGFEADDTIDPYSVALIKLRAGLPDDRPNHFLQLIAFGGTTIYNNTQLQGDEVKSVTITNTSDDIFNLRVAPGLEHRVIAGLPPGETIEAISRTEDSQWLRVQFVDRDDRPITAWLVICRVGEYRQSLTIAYQSTTTTRGGGLQLQHDAPRLGQGHGSLP